MKHTLELTVGEDVQVATNGVCRIELCGGGNGEKVVRAVCDEVLSSLIIMGISVYTYLNNGKQYILSVNGDIIRQRIN